MRQSDRPANAKPPGSYWEASAEPLGIDLGPLDGDLRYDVVVAGAGYTGLSAALHLAHGYGARVCVIDAAYPGWGASGRNGGWACMGSSRLSWPAIIRRFGLQDAQRFYAIQREAIKLVRQICSEWAIEADATRDGLLTLAHRKRAFAELAAESKFLRERFGEHSVLFDAGKLAEGGWRGSGFHGGLLQPHGFGLHPLRYLHGLARATVGSGVSVFPGSPMISWSKRGKLNVVDTPGGKLTADHLIFATNAYTPEAIAKPLRGCLLPVVSTILVTRPLTQAELEAQGWTRTTPAADTRHILHYFRLLPDNRFLIGGRGTTDSSDESARKMERRLRADFERMFPVWKDVEHTHNWAGYVCLSAVSTPFIGALDGDKTVWSALAYHGNGVAMGTWSGRALAGMVSGDPAALSLPGFLTRRPRSFPLPSMRRQYLKAAYVYYGLRDNLI